MGQHAAVGDALAVRRDQPSRDRARPGDRDLLPDDGAHRDLEPVDVAGHPQSRTLAARAARSTGSVDRCSSIATGSASRSSSRRHRSTADARSRRSDEPELAHHVVVVRRQGHRPVPVGKSHRAAVGQDGRRRSRPSTRSRRPRGRRGRSSSAVGVERLAHRERDRHQSRPGGRRGAPPRRDRRACRSWVGVASYDLGDGRVELPHAGEAGREGHVGEAHLGRLDQDARGVGPLGACQRERPGAELFAEQPVEVARRVAGPRRESFDPVALDDAVGDHPHRATGDVGLDVPLGRARRQVGPATPAGPETCALRCGRGDEERDVLALRRGRRAGRPAVDAGRADAGVEDPVEAAVASLHRAVAAVGVAQDLAAVGGRRAVHVLHQTPRHRQDLAAFGHGRGGGVWPMD